LGVVNIIFAAYITVKNDDDIVMFLTHQLFWSNHPSSHPINSYIPSIPKYYLEKHTLWKTNIAIKNGDL
jgi:hypothetical protein